MCHQRNYPQSLSKFTTFSLHWFSLFFSTIPSSLWPHDFLMIVLESFLPVKTSTYHYCLPKPDSPSRFDIRISSLGMPSLIGCLLYIASISLVLFYSFFFFQNFLLLELSIYVFTCLLSDSSKFNVKLLKCREIYLT